MPSGFCHLKTSPPGVSNDEWQPHLPTAASVTLETVQPIQPFLLVCL